MQKERPSRNGLQTLAETRRALVRASVLFGTIGVLFAFAVGAPESRSNRMADSGSYGVDEMMTGSIGTAPDRYVERRSVLQRTGAGPCLYFPDGSQRGAC